MRTPRISAATAAAQALALASTACTSGEVTSPAIETVAGEVAQRMFENGFVPQDDIPRVLARDPMERDEFFAGGEAEMYFIESDDMLIAITPDGLVEDVIVDNYVAHGQDWRSSYE